MLGKEQSKIAKWLRKQSSGCEIRATDLSGLIYPPLDHTGCWIKLIFSEKCRFPRSINKAVFLFCRSSWLVFPVAEVRGKDLIMDIWPQARQRELSQVLFPEMGGIQRPVETQLFLYRYETKAVTRCVSHHGAGLPAWGCTCHSHARPPGKAHRKCLDIS